MSVSTSFMTKERGSSDNIGHRYTRNPSIFLRQQEEIRQGNRS